MEGLPLVCYPREGMNSLLHKLRNLKNHSSSSLAKEISELASEVEGLKRDFIDKIASLRERHIQVTVWMKQVRDLFFDIEDWIDLKPDTNMLDPSHTEDINYFKTEIKEARERFAWYDLLEQVPTQFDLAVEENTTIDPLLAEEKTCHGLFNDSRDTIEKHLLDKQIRLKVVSVVGIEGLGKTTLANEVYEKLRLQGHFDCHAFVSVGRRTTSEILPYLYYQVHSTRAVVFPEGRSPQGIISKLRQYLSDKRYFIVLDGIWSIRAWKVINCALPANNHGSRVLTTTCIADIGKFCAGHPNDVVYQMSALSKENSRILYHSRISLLEKETHAYSEDDSGNMLNMCGGMPLAIIVAAGLFTRKSEEKTESKMLGKSVTLTSKLNFKLEGMENILHMSYSDLSLPVRYCFLYLSIFPENYAINKYRLIRLWGAEGFIPVLDKGYSWETGERYFNELISRRLIQPVFSYDDDQAIGCTIHGVILDFIRLLSREENFAIRAAELSSGPFPCDTIRRFSFHKNNEDEAGTIETITMHLSRLRSFTASGDGIFDPPFPSVAEEELHFQSVSIVRVSLLAFKHMRVLDLENTRKLGDRHLEGIGGLVLLRYLGLGSTGIRVLPRETRKLQQLETIDLRGNGEISIQSASLKSFQKLVCLLGDFLEILDIDIILEMPALEEVSMVRAWNKNSLDKVAEMMSKSKRLRMLGVDFEISADNHTLSFFTAVQSSNLYSLTVNCCNCDAAAVLLLLDSWEKAIALSAVTFEPRRLELMFRGGGALSGLPPNIASIFSLTHLDIKLYKVESEDLVILGGLPNLVYLHLTSYHSFSESKIIDKGVFPCLKVLLFTCPFNSTMGLEFSEGSVKQLRSLRIEFKAHKSTVRDIFPVLGIKHLTCLTRVHVIFDCNRSTVLEVESAVAHVKDQVFWNPNKPTLIVNFTREDVIKREQHTK